MCLLINSLFAVSKIIHKNIYKKQVEKYKWNKKNIYIINLKMKNSALKIYRGKNTTAKWKRQREQEKNL